jgi:hypothetical protein
VKRCARCREVKPLEEFHRQTKASDGRQSWCKPCAARGSREDYAKHKASPQRLAFKRNKEYRRLYGITLADYDEMFAAQDGVCATCGSPDPGVKHDHLHVDHCHETGRVRGLLCRRCNSVIGYVHDNPDTLRRMADYLEAPALIRRKAVQP